MPPRWRNPPEDDISPPQLKQRRLTLGANPNSNCHYYACSLSHRLWDYPSNGITSANPDACADAPRRRLSGERRWAYRYRLYSRREVIDYDSGRAIARLPERKSGAHAGSRLEQPRLLQQRTRSAWRRRRPGFYEQ